MKSVTLAKLPNFFTSSMLSMISLCFLQGLNNMAGIRCVSQFLELLLFYLFVCFYSRTCAISLEGSKRREVVRKELLERE